MKIKLDDIDKKNPYDVPSGYFEDLTSKVQSKIEKRSAMRPATTWALKWALAPSLVLLILLTFWLKPKHETEKVNSLLSQVSDDDILDYLAQGELDEMELLSLSSHPEHILEHSPNYLNGIDLDQQSLEELYEEFDLNDTYF